MLGQRASDLVTTISAHATTTAMSDARANVNHRPTEAAIDNVEHTAVAAAVLRGPHEIGPRRRYTHPEACQERRDSQRPHDASDID